MAAPAVSPPAAQVGQAFVLQYYQILNQSPGLLYRFYQDDSKLGRIEDDGSMSITTTMDEINAKIMSVDYDETRAEFKTVDSQESLNGGVYVLVTGYMTGKDNSVQNFTQAFFLAPQEKGYYVLNDILRFMESADYSEGDLAPAVDVEAPVIHEKAPEVVPVPESNVSEQAVVLPDESDAEKVVHVDNGDVPTAEEEDPVSEVVEEVPDSSQLVAESNVKVEEQPKKSYASIVMDYKQSSISFSTPAPAARKAPTKKQEHLNNAPPTAVAAEPVVLNVDAPENGNHEEEAEGFSVYIKNLPVSATVAMVEEEFKKFGPIKPNGVQVRNNKPQGFGFGFVEFEVPEAAQKAIEASPVTINGRNAVVEEKRSSIRGGNRGRFVAGRGPGFIRSDGMRGRGNYVGGRGFGRGGDFGGNRNDYGFRGNSRGGGSNRGGDGYQRDNNGGRVNRGQDVNGTARNTAQ
uniref:nuclear transport factor 2 isoform X2 n=1 Tax=Erigeron canadensis TaxID=72917 RepID=UPI001CB9B3F8|nr:nuclear transport factor 2 isoform X2 [Erigeron canadensis]